MTAETEIKLRQDLYAEITFLEESFRQINSGLLAKDYDASIVASALKTFKDSLNRASAYALALYTIRGKQVTFSWEHLFIHLDYAIAAVNGSPTLKQRDTVQAILTMSKTEFEQVLTYFAALKESIK
jgi:HPt (histidine-containing phosphotransfer) domain-containing protein